jgi:ketosteroid isomerase-like protein
MKTLVNKTGITMILLAFVATSGFSQTTDELKAKIMKINRQIAQAMVEGNTAISLGHYTKDAVSLPSYHKMVQGIDAIKKSNEEMMSSGMKVKSFEMNTVMVNSYGSMISEIGTYKMSMSMPGAPNPVEDQGKYLTLWEKQPDGSLKIKVETWNTDINPMVQQH